MLAALRKHRHLVYSMVARNLRLQYMGSFFGAAWIVLKPVAWMAIYSFALSMILRARTGAAFGAVPFPVWLLTGLLSYMFFSEAATTGVNCITSQANLIKKSLFDKSVLPLCAVVTSFVNHLVGLGVLLIVMICFGIPFRAVMLLLPIVSAALFLYVLGWVYLLSAIQVFVRDMSQMVSVVLQLLFFLTPIIYPQQLVPRWALPFMKANPHFFFVGFYRQILLLGKFPDIFLLVGIGAGSFLFCVFGKRVFDRLAPDFADVL